MASGVFLYGTPLQSVLNLLLEFASHHCLAISSFSGDLCECVGIGRDHRRTGSEYKSSNARSDGCDIISSLVTLLFEICFTCAYRRFRRFDFPVTIKLRFLSVSRRTALKPFHPNSSTFHLNSPSQHSSAAPFTMWAIIAILSLVLTANSLPEPSPKMKIAPVYETLKNFWDYVGCIPHPSDVHDYTQVEVFGTKLTPERCLWRIDDIEENYNTTVGFLNGKCWRFNNYSSVAYSPAVRNLSDWGMWRDKPCQVHRCKNLLPVGIWDYSCGGDANVYIEEANVTVDWVHSPVPALCIPASHLQSNSRANGKRS